MTPNPGFKVKVLCKSVYFQNGAVVQLQNIST